MAALASFGVTRVGAADLPPPNYDESTLAPYRLPELLRCQDGTLLQSAADFSAKRRPELLELFRQHVYGRISAELSRELRVEVTRVRGPEPFAGSLGLQSELDVSLRARDGRTLTVRALVHAPAGSQGPSPTFLSLNLFGNQSLHADPRIRLAVGWVPDHAELGLSGHVASAASRGMHAGRWPIELLLSRGYALVTAYAGDLDPDYDDAFQNGLHALLPPAGSPRPGDAPGTIAAWAFGLSRLLDAIEQLPELDARRVAVVGHSRLGKTALWAAAQDERFALAISNESGCGGATLSRRRYGERLLHINRRFPHWFCPAFHGFDEREHELPVDQHQLLALLAPRPLYVASAVLDQWADPHGEWLACEAAAPAWALFGHDATPTHVTAPNPSQPASRLGYHVRPGKHDMTPRDFWHYLAFADRWL